VGDDKECCEPVTYSVPGEGIGQDMETKRVSKGHSLPAAAEGRGRDGTSQETERKRASKKHSLARTECETSFSGSPCHGVDVRVWWNRGTATVGKTCLYIKVCRSRVRRSARCVLYR